MKKNLKINIKDLSFKCIVGILDFERVKKQKVIINISFTYTYKKNSFIDYSHIAKLVEKKMKKKKFELLEDAIIYFENLLYKKYQIKDLKLSISKPDILKNCVVSLDI